MFDGYLIFLDSIETNDFQVIKNNRNLFSSKHVGQKNGKLCTDTLLIVGLLHFSFWDEKKFKFEKYFFLSNTPIIFYRLGPHEITSYANFLFFWRFKFLSDHNYATSRQSFSLSNFLPWFLLSIFLFYFLSVFCFFLMIFGFIMKTLKSQNDWNFVQKILVGIIEEKNFFVFVK